MAALTASTRPTLPASRPARGSWAAAPVQRQHDHAGRGEPRHHDRPERVQQPADVLRAQPGQARPRARRCPRRIWSSTDADEPELVQRGHEIGHREPRPGLRAQPRRDLIDRSGARRSSAMTRCGTSGTEMKSPVSGRPITQPSRSRRSAQAAQPHPRAARDAGRPSSRSPSPPPSSPRPPSRPAGIALGMRRSAEHLRRVDARPGSPCSTRPGTTGGIRSAARRRCGRPGTPTPRPRSRRPRRTMAARRCAASSACAADRGVAGPRASLDCTPSMAPRRARRRPSGRAGRGNRRRPTGASPR